METASVSLHTSFSLANRLNRSLASPSILKPFNRRNSSLSLQFRGHQSELSVRQQASHIAAVAGNTTAIPRDHTAEHPSASEKDGQTKEAPEGISDQKMVIICDKLIGVFMVDKPTPKDWRRLLAFSRTWNDIRPHFFKRVQERADAEDDPDKKLKLMRFGRKLKEIDEDVKRHNELLEVIKGANSDMDSIIARRRKDFTTEFFEHLYGVTESYHDNPEEQKALGELGCTCMAAVEAYDNATESVEKLNTAQLKFEDIINSPSLDVACKKIDDLADKNQLDPALMMMISKAWSAAKETDLTKSEAKDILYHLYMTAVGNFQRLMPDDIRILKYLLTVDDPEVRLSSLKDAFTPGDQIQGAEVDYIYTTPEKLHFWIKAVLDAYYSSTPGTLVWQARDMMHPETIKRLEVLKKEVEDNYM